MWSTISTLIALPILALISIPLILSAWVTISFALIAIILRLSVIYVELVYGILVHFLSLPTSPTSSLLTFVASEPPTPVSGRSRRNSNHGTHRKHDSASSWAFGTTVDDHRKRNSYARSMIEAHLSPSTPLHAFPISNDERRDFEGVGGWRSYPTKSRSSHEKATWTSSSSSLSDVDPTVDADERAWLSLNHRLELPSQLITLSTSTYAGSNLNSPTGDNDSRNGRSFHSLLGAADSINDSGSRHHHRSLTTSSLTTSDRRTGTGLSLASSTRPDNVANSKGYISMSSSIPRLPPSSMTPQLFAPSHSQSRAARGSQTGAPFTSSYLSSSGELGHSFGSNSSGNFDRGGGYFSLRRPGSSGSHVSGRVSPIASGYTTPGVGISTEDRDASLCSARLMAHYPTSPRHRRQSVSGPARGIGGERLG
ncbi:hypothetical protein N7452_008658 [Penicillium brevicompactum]|uniref:Uncharacterized protein n=1 Tax=Penicillium brevicompactum TaxID=5074 RepID=A0A9W9QA91_PENBR|nr:hypothetical protein N7452_008658 [Penicillium brevicompactum]